MNSYEEALFEGYIDALAESCKGGSCMNAKKLSRPNPNDLTNKKDKVIKNHYVTFEEDEDVELDESFLEGYFDGLQESVAGKVAAGAAAAGLIGLGVHGYKMNNDLNYRKKHMDKANAKREAKSKAKYEKYKARGGKLSYEKWKDPIECEYERYKIDGGTGTKAQYIKDKDEAYKRRQAELEHMRQKQKEYEEAEERRARINAYNAQARKDREIRRQLQSNR